MGSMHTGLEEVNTIFGSKGLHEMAGIKYASLLLLLFILLHVDHLLFPPEFYAERARGGVGLIVTGGISPNAEGRTTIGAAMMTNERHADAHVQVTEAVHGAGGHIAMQILHTGRYGYHFSPVSASAIRSPISYSSPKALSASEIRSTISDFVRCAKLAQRAGYDGVEVMGSEGYLINQFIAAKTNKRTDEWGGSYENRIRLPLEIVSGIRQAVGPNFLIIYRLSMLDLVDNASSWAEVVELAQRIEAAGASLINTGIGWYGVCCYWAVWCLCM